MNEIVERSPLINNPEVLNFGPYMFIADETLRLISVFDDLKYDRADLDMMSPAMRGHVIKQLNPIGFKQVSGNVLLHAETDVRCLIPKFHALGSSPFDITRYIHRGKNDFYVLTPTQTACQYIDHYSLEEAVERAVSEARKIDEASMAKHNRDATVISMILGFTTLALFVDGLLLF